MMNEMINEMAYTFDNNIVSDLHKDAFGMRPSSMFWERWNSYSDDERQREWDRLIVVMERSIELDRMREAEAAETFEKRVEDTIVAGAGDRDTAIRWIMDADNALDLEHLCWINGLNFNYFKKAI